MLIKQNLFVFVLFTLSIYLVYLTDSISAAKKATKSSGGETEFHLTCTVLVNGSPDGSGSTGDGDDYEDDETETRSKKRKYKRSVREKRSDTKVQLLCDIDNPRGQEVAMRSVKQKKKGEKEA